MSCKWTRVADRVRVFRPKTPIVVAAATIIALSCLMSGNAVASTATGGARLMPVAIIVGPLYPDPGIAAAPSCAKGANARKVAAKYKAKKYKASGYRTDVLYCGNNSYGYRHIEPHIGQYFGGWSNFTFSMAQTLKAPAAIVAQKNGNYMESAPIYQCFYAGYYVIWTFYAIPQIKSGTVVTVYGHKGKTVDKPCP